MRLRFPALLGMRLRRATGGVPFSQTRDQLVNLGTRLQACCGRVCADPHPRQLRRAPRLRLCFAPAPDDCEAGAHAAAVASLFTFLHISKRVTWIKSALNLCPRSVCASAARTQVPSLLLSASPRWSHEPSTSSSGNEPACSHRPNRPSSGAGACVSMNPEMWHSTSLSRTPSPWDRPCPQDLVGCCARTARSLREVSHSAHVTASHLKSSLLSELLIRHPLCGRYVVWPLRGKELRQSVGTTTATLDLPCSSTATHSVRLKLQVLVLWVFCVPSM